MSRKHTQAYCYCGKDSNDDISSDNARTFIAGVEGVGNSVHGRPVGVLGKSSANAIETKDDCAWPSYRRCNLKRLPFAAHNPGECITWMHGIGYDVRHSFLFW